MKLRHDGGLNRNGLRMQLALYALLALATGCASTERGGTAGTMPATAPEPGTQAYYDQRIVDQYAYDGEKLVPIREAGQSSVRSLRTFADWVEGPILDIRDGNLLVVGRVATNASGALRTERGCVLVPLPDPRERITNAWIRALAVSDGNYRYTTESGSTGNLPGLREVREPTFEEYRKIYERDLQGASAPPVISVALAAVPPRLAVRRVPEETPALPQADAHPVVPLTYAERLRQRQERQERESDGIRAELEARTTEVVQQELARVEREGFQKRVTSAGELDKALVTAEASGVRTNGLYVYEVNATGHAVIAGFDRTYAGALAITNTLGGAPVTEIARGAFAGCQGITEVILPESLVAIDHHAFHLCTSLSSVRIPSGLTDIGLAAFFRTALRSVTIPSSVTRIGSGAFRCHVEVAGDNSFYCSADGVLFDKAKTRLIGFPVAKTGSYTIPNGITAIDTYAFSGCVGLSGIAIPESVTTIGISAFHDCTGLSSVIVPASVTNIYRSAFGRCANLTAIYFAGDAPPRLADATEFRDMATNAVAYRRPDAKGWGETFGGLPVKVWNDPAKRVGLPASTEEPADVRRDGAFGFPQTAAQLLCDTLELRVSAWNDARHLVVQSVIWGDGEDTVGETPDGRQIGDWSTLNIDVDADQKATPNTDRKYSLNPWHRLPGLHYQRVLSEHSWTGLVGDSKGRGSIRYVNSGEGKRVRVDTYVIPLDEIGKQTGETLRLAYWASSRKPEMTLNSTGFKLDGSYPSYRVPRALYHDIALVERTEKFNIRMVPEGREDIAVPAATPAPPGRPPARPSPATPTAGAVEHEKPVPALQVGDPTPRLAQGKYVQGEPVAAFEKGTVYVVEFWATWCGPCRAVIPHVNALQEKYKDKGLVVIGQNVWQRGENVEADVTAFVKEMGERMTCRVALDRDGAMAATWMKAAGRGGIPSAFVVDREGKIAWIGHPSSGLDAAVEKALGDGAGE